MATDEVAICTCCKGREVEGYIPRYGVYISNLCSKCYVKCGSTETNRVFLGRSFKENPEIRLDAGAYNSLAPMRH